jgi:thioredoxin family protein
MKIEILYFEGCPNHELAVERVQEILREEGISADVVEVNVNDSRIAHEIGFLGTPTVRVNGLDAEPSATAAREYGIICRTYAAGGRREGVPSREMLRTAILAASGVINK